MLGPDGDLALIRPATGVAKFQIANLHGEIVTQLDNINGPRPRPLWTTRPVGGWPRRHAGSRRPSQCGAQSAGKLFTRVGT